MPQPIVIAYHLVWTAYGWWLPNDPRGSHSREVRSEAVAALGELHHGRKRVQPAGRVIREFYDQARAALRHPLLTFDAAARDAVGRAFGAVVAAERYTCYACAVMPDHVHVLIRKHKYSSEEMTERLQHASRDHLIATGHREPGHPTWGGPGRKVYLDHPPTRSGGPSPTSSETRSRSGSRSSTGRSSRRTTAGRSTRGTARTPRT